MRYLSPYATTFKVNHNYKGNAALIAGQLDPAKQKDLRTNHFSIGGHSANVTQTTFSLSHRPMSAQNYRDAKPIVN